MSLEQPRERGTQSRGRGNLWSIPPPSNTCNVICVFVCLYDLYRSPWPTLERGTEEAGGREENTGGGVCRGSTDWHPPQVPRWETYWHLWHRGDYDWSENWRGGDKEEEYPQCAVGRALGQVSSFLWGWVSWSSTSVYLESEAWSCMWNDKYFNEPSQQNMKQFLYWLVIAGSCFTSSAEAVTRQAQSNISEQLSIIQKAKEQAWVCLTTTYVQKKRISNFYLLCVKQREGTAWSKGPAHSSAAQAFPPPSNIQSNASVPGRSCYAPPTWAPSTTCDPTTGRKRA